MSDFTFRNYRALNFSKKCLKQTHTHTHNSNRRRLPFNNGSLENDNNPLKDNVYLDSKTSPHLGSKQSLGYNDITEGKIKLSCTESTFTMAKLKRSKAT